MDLLLIDQDAAMCQAWIEHFGELPAAHQSRYTILNGYIEDMDTFDALVIPGNSFGFMDSGISRAATAMFGDTLPQSVRNCIDDEYLGEQPVGTALIVRTGHTWHPYVVHTPIMRYPMRTAHMDYAYKSTWAALLAVRHHNRHADQHAMPPIETVAVVGMRASVGESPVQQVARQMALAFRNFLQPPERVTWHMAANRQQEVRYGGDDGFQFPPEWA